MKGASKVIMGATLVMVVALAIVLGLILVLLAELYCSLLLRRRKMRGSAANNTAPNATTSAASAINSFSSSSDQPHQTQQDQSTSPLSSLYTQGVLHAPRNLLFPAVSCKPNKCGETRNQLSLLHHVLDVHTQVSNPSPHRIGILSPASSTSTSFMTSPQPVQEVLIKVGAGAGVNACIADKGCSGAGGGEHFMYISNPIYDNDGGSCRRSRADTPFETPDTSPSRLENSGSSGDDDDDQMAQPSCRASSSHSPPLTPPLTPMKKLPAQACSVSLRDARSLGTSGSDSNSNNGLSSSSSGSPSTSPSW